MHRLTTLFCFLVMLQPIYCQTDTLQKDTLVYFDELNFISQNEKAGLSKESKLTDIDLLNIALNAKTTEPGQSKEWFEKHYNELFDNFTTEKFQSLKPEKKIKFIYSTVHDKLLKKYLLNVTFDELFINGNYNCVTATMLYGLILYRLNIPFDIKETPEHVYLVAKTDSKSTRVESTDPSKGYISYNQSYKEKFIEYLEESKLITASELLNQGMDSIFQKYYFTEKNINLTQLAGIQYYNNGIALLTSNNYKLTLEQFQKSYLLYPAEKTKYLLLGCLGNLIINATYLEKNDWQYYVYLTRFKHEKLNTAIMKDEFIRLTQKVLIEKSNLDKYQQAYQYIIHHISDSLLQEQISYVYNYETGRYFITTNRNKEAFPYIEAAYKINPDNYEIQNVFVTTFLSAMEGFQEEEVFSKLEGYYNNYEKLRTDPRISQMLLMVYLYQAETNFETEKWADGDIYLNKFEKMFEEGQSKQFYYNQIEQVYTRIAAHFFKLNNNKKAKEYILRGLKYYPESYRLKNSLKMF